MLSDAHCHLAGSRELANLQQQDQILTIINCQSPAEWDRNTLLTGAHQHLSFGIHPWQATDFRWPEVTPYLEKTRVVGEIGLDNVWTDVNLLDQSRVFEAQLQFAHDHCKPVILHTKGCERAVLKTIQKYPNRYMVHWYATKDYQRDYIRLDCFFTIGVDVLTDPAVAQLAQDVPLNRILIETDGLEAIHWAGDTEATVADYPHILHRSIRAVAALRGMASDELEAQVYRNLEAFLA